MTFILQTTRKIGFSAFILGVCLFSVQTAFSQLPVKAWVGASGAAWSTAANWSPTGVPANSDSVIIAAGQNVVVTSGTAVARKLSVYGSGSSQGKVTVNSGATLTVSAFSNVVINGISNAAIILFGGMIENNGTMTATGKQSMDAIRFDNPTSGTLSSTYMGSGTLTCSTGSDPGCTGGTGCGGGNTTTGASITFAQTSGTATFTVGGTSYTFNTATGLASNLKSVINCVNGAAQINAPISGMGTITISGARRAIRMQTSTTSINPSLTIESGVTMELSTTMVTSAASTGIVLIDNAVASATASITNKGTLNFTGTHGNPIWMNNATAATSTTNFTNEGTISINGAFTDATLNVTLAGIYMAGGANSFGNSFTNSGTIDFNTTVSGTSIKPLLLCSITPLCVINNSGTITVGTNGAPPIAFRLGDGETTVNNTGTITVGAGNISGFVSTGNAAFNNNTGGTVNFNQTAAATVVSGNVAFTNAGGTIKGSGTFTNNNGTSTGTNTFTSGTITPGQSPGKIILADLALTLNGTYNAEIDGTAGAGVTGGYDQIEASTASAAVTVSGLTIAATINYTPANSDAIVLVKTTGGSITGTPTFSPILPAGWAVTTTGGEVKITYTAPLAAELTTFKATPLSKINVLTWATASEINNKGFDVQRKTATGAWETLGFVNGTGKASTYSFEDKDPLSISYYRLRQVDFDGKETLSKIVSVSQNTKGRISITPNPTSDKVNIQLNQNDVSNQTATIVLSDMTGRQVLTQTTTASIVELDLSNLAKGMYVMTVQSNNAIYQEKIIRQ